MTKFMLKNIKLFNKNIITCEVAKAQKMKGKPRLILLLEIQV